jgi:hypothetical protein
MKNAQIKIDKEKLHSLYMKEVNRIADIFEDKSHFGPEELIAIVAGVLEKNPEIIIEKKPRL